MGRRTGAGGSAQDVPQGGAGRWGWLIPVLLSGAVLLAAPARAQSPALVWLTGFEHGVVSLQGGGLFDAWNVTPEIIPAVARSGRYGLRISAGSEFEFVRRPFPATPQVVIRFHVRLPQPAGVHPAPSAPRADLGPDGQAPVQRHHRAPSGGLLELRPGRVPPGHAGGLAPGRHAGDHERHSEDHRVGGRRGAPGHGVGGRRRGRPHSSPDRRRGVRHLRLRLRRLRHVPHRRGLPDRRGLRGAPAPERGRWPQRGRQRDRAAGRAGHRRGDGLRPAGRAADELGRRLRPSGRGGRGSVRRGAVRGRGGDGDPGRDGPAGVHLERHERQQRRLRGEAGRWHGGRDLGHAGRAARHVRVRPFLQVGPRNPPRRRVDAARGERPAHEDGLLDRRLPDSPVAVRALRGGGARQRAGPPPVGGAERWRPQHRRAHRRDLGHESHVLGADAGAGGGGRRAAVRGHGDVLRGLRERPGPDVAFQVRSAEGGNARRGPRRGPRSASTAPTPSSPSGKLRTRTRLSIRPSATSTPRETC